jgi:tRNA(Ile)-lysidine synthase
MAKNLAGRLQEAIRKQNLVRAGQRIGVAVSGGADSVALLRLLVEFQEELGLVLSVVHLNHKLRGKAADADEKFVANLAKTHGLELHVERVAVAAKAKREKANVEDAGRRARYDFFARLMAERKVDRVAVAHTADDQAETVLVHILRGTGLAGLGGIHPETETVVRPLLHVRRAELRAYLRSKKQKWREDATNQDTSRMRARIRKKLLPLLERKFQHATVEHLIALAEFAREDERFLDLIARQRCEALTKKAENAVRIAIVDLLSPMQEEDFNTENTKGFTEDTEKTEGQKKEGNGRFEALTKRMLRRLIEKARVEAGPRASQMTAQHISAVLELARHGQSGKTLQLPRGVDVRRERDELVFLQRVATKSFVTAGSTQTARAKRAAVRVAVTGDAATPASYEHQIDIRNGAASLEVPQAHCVFRFRVIDWPANRGETRTSGTVLDRDRLHGPLVLRNWRPGDRLQPTGHQKAHKLKRLLNEKRVSRWEREGWPVVTSAGRLVWARGFPVAAEFAASESTRRAVAIDEEKA